MRQVFSSPRLSNVEAVAELLEGAGIAIKITNGRSYRGNFDRGISYRGGGEDGHAAVWVTRSEDQPRARQMLREAGLLDSTRPDQQRDSFLPDHLRMGGAKPVTSGRWLSPGRLKVLLLIAIALVMGLAALWQRRSDPAPEVVAPTTRTLAHIPAPAASAPDVLSARNAAPVIQRVDVPSALATLLIAHAANQRDFDKVCVQVDDAAPSERTLTLLADLSNAPSLAPAAQCTEASKLPSIRIDDYQTDGSGSGMVRMRIQQGKLRVDQRFDVIREGHDWRIIGNTRR